jgi:hypothetical protein
MICAAVVNAGPNATEYTFIKEELIHIKKMIDNEYDYKTDEYIENIQIPIQHIKPFADYLARSKKELLESDRQTLLKKIKALN